MQSKVDIRQSRGSYAVHIPAALTVDGPVTVLCNEDLDVTLSAEEDSRATVFLDVRAGRCSVDADVGRDASLIIICLQHGGVSGVSIVQKGHIAEGGSLHWSNMTLGSGVSHKLTSEVSGSDGRSDIDWIFFVRDENRQTVAAENIFSAANGRGEITMRGIALERGRAECKGMIRIGARGSGTNTYLTQSILMLDPTAHVDAVPGLEIKTNDVKASHSATVSRITPEDLFTFSARGIEEEDARAMIVGGFIGEMIGKIADPEVRGIVEEALLAASC